MHHQAHDGAVMPVNKTGKTNGVQTNNRESKQNARILTIILPVIANRCDAQEVFSHLYCSGVDRGVLTSLH